MAFLDWVTGKIACPRCGTQGAKEINGSVHCPNPTCEYFSTSVGKSSAAPPPLDFRQPAEVPAGSIAIQYRNFQGQGKTFVAQIASARRTSNHISVKVAPKGARIFLSRDRIVNLNDVEAAFAQRGRNWQNVPTPRERQVLAYHQKRRSTSPLYQSIRAKYPDW